MRTPLLLAIAADAAGDRTALGSTGRGTSFSEYNDRALHVAAWLKASGKANAAFLGLNGAALPILFFASGVAGMPFVPLNYRLADLELNKLLNRTSPAMLVCDDDMLERISTEADIEIVARSEFERRFLHDLAPGGADVPESDNDVAVMLFTSGTTGEPKAAVLRHANLTSYVMSTVDFLGADEDEAALISVPSYHIAGISAILTSAYSGRRIVYLPAFTADEWVATAAAERITHAMVVPTMLDRILDVMIRTGDRLPSLRAISYGGGKMPLPVIERALAMLPHVAFVNAYGLTETSSTISLLGAEDHRSAFASDDPVIRRRIASVGQPLPAVELEIRREDGSCCAPGERGEICVRGEQVSGEYLHKKATSDDGWFATNDAGWLDEGGYLFVEGRLDDIIVRGGENISPGEIEDLLRGFDDVADCAVIGVPCEQWGEKIVAVVVSRSGKPDFETMASELRSQIRSTKTPEQWFLRAELPYNETGKLLRRVIRAELAEAACAD